MQFDVQAQRRASTPASTTSSPCGPFPAEGSRHRRPRRRGSDEIVVGDASRFQPGALLGVGLDQDGTFEAATIAAINGTRSGSIDRFAFAHAAGEIVSTEFVRYRWYPDAQFGTSYFHDHVNALTSWSHGLFGALDRRATGLDLHRPAYGRAAAKAAPIADIHTDGQGRRPM